MCLLNAWNNNVISNPNLEHPGPDQSTYLPNVMCFPEESGFMTSDGYYWTCTWGRRVCLWGRVYQLGQQLYVGMLMLMELSRLRQSFGCPLRPHASKHSVVSWFNYELVVIAMWPAVVSINLCSICVWTLCYSGVKLCPDMFSNIHELAKVEVLHNILEKSLMGLTARESGSVISRKRGSCHITAAEDWWGCTASALWILHVLTKKH